ncbi:MAG: tetratricopeptide repeat protein [Anaerolineaceae bacterium]|nr:tetratricopeptide repeat protein [Anaerolineaceae bacterium]
MNTNGQLKRWFLIAIGIGLPWLLVFFLQLQPFPQQLSTAWQEVRSAETRLRFQSAAKAMREILEFQPWRTELWIRLGRFYLQAGKWEEAVESLSGVASRPNFDSEGAFSLGEAYWQSGKPEQAIKIWKPLVISEEAPPELYSLLEGLQRQQGDMDGALQTLNYWIERVPDSAYPKLELGFLLAVDNPSSAAEVLNQAINIDRTLSGRLYPLRKALKGESLSKRDHLMQTGRALAGLGQWDLAEILFERAIQQNSEDAEAWAFFGEAQQQMGKDGLPALVHAEDLSPNSPTVQALMSLYWRRHEKPDRALILLRTLAATEPEESIWQLELGSAAAETGDLMAAMAYFQNAVKMEPENPLVWSSLARFCVEYMVAAREVGLPAARRLLELSPNDQEGYVLMGRLLFSLGDLASAERFLLQGVSLDPSEAPANLVLGQLYLQEEKYEPAFYYLQKAVTLSNPGQVEGLLAKRLLDRFFPGTS